MKKLTLLLAVVFAAGVAYAGDAPAADKAAAKPAEAPAKAKAVATTHDVEAEIVSVDTTKNTVTLKGEKGEHTAPVEGAKAQAELKALKAGQKVTVTCRDENGEHKAVTAIKPSTGTAKAPAMDKAKPADTK